MFGFAELDLIATFVNDENYWFRFAWSPSLLI